MDSANGPESRVNNVCELQLTGTHVFTSLTVGAKRHTCGNMATAYLLLGDERTEGKSVFQLKNISLALERRKK